MQDRKWKIGKVEIFFRPGSKLLKIMVILLIVFSTAAIAALWWVRNDILRRTEDIRAEAAAVEYENQMLEEKIDQLGSLQSMLEIAEEELGMVTPDTILIQPQS